MVCAYVREINHSLKLVDYLPVHAHKPYNNLHLSYDVTSGSDITPCINSDKPLVLYILCISTLCNDIHNNVDNI